MIPRAFPPAPGWPPGGHPITAPREDARGPAKTGAYGGPRAAGGPAITRCAPSRTSTACQDFLHRAERANPGVTIDVITGNPPPGHDSTSTRAWPEDHPRSRHAFIPQGACRRNPQKGWRRIVRRQALAGQSFAGPAEIAHATQVATAQARG